MANSEFKPKPGKPRSDRGIKTARLTPIVAKATARWRAPRSPWANALTKRPVAELGRGKGALYGLTPPPAGWRRVVVKARIARHGTSDLAAARSHQHYLVRDGVSRVGSAGQLYDRDQVGIDGGAFLERQQGDTYQFRLIVAPEDAGRIADLKPFVRDLMAQMEEDLQTRLDWVAVDHFNTGHPHTHIIIAGHDDRGQDLVMARHYISHGIRTRARDLVTLELGPEQELERAVKLANEMKAERLTSLDRGILKDAEESVLVVSAMIDGSRGRQALRIGRLRHLEQMGLADEQQTGVWSLDPQMEAKLRSMGERGDIMVTMHQVMRDHGIDRPAGDFALFGGAAKSTPVIGKVVEVGIADELTDRKYLVVDGIDGHIHYAETAKFSGHDMPESGMIVALTGGSGKSKARPAQVEILSYWPIEKLATVEAATWLDHTICAEARPVIRETGFGAEVSKALVAREDWLIAKGHAIAGQTGTITPKPDMAQALHQGAVALASNRLEQQLDVPHLAAFDGMRFSGKHVGTVDLPLQRLAVIKGRNAFILVSWRPELMQMRGKDIAVGINDRAMSLAIARGRDLGLSR